MLHPKIIIITNEKSSEDRAPAVIVGKEMFFFDCKILQSSKSILHHKKEISQSKKIILQSTKRILQARIVHAELAFFATQKSKMQSK
jgi:hypothetical protein